jgi:hypothetical protein
MRDIRWIEMTETSVLEQTIAEALALRILVKNFINDNEIRCAESVYQTDYVAENSLEFIESLCEVVGYYEDD